MKKFCVIARDYESHVPREHKIDDPRSTSIHRGLQSLANQTFKDFNVVICHDGPKQKSYIDEGIDFVELGLDPHLIQTPIHMGFWGNDSVDTAMRYAYKNNLGEYFINFNIDNIFFDNAFEVINDAIEEYKKLVYIFSIHHLKQDGEKFLDKVFSGIPPEVNKIDFMQLVASRDVWKNNGFYLDKKSYSADATNYKIICRRNEYIHIPEVLGINF